MPGGPTSAKTKPDTKGTCLRAKDRARSKAMLDAIATPSATAQLKGIFAEKSVTLKR